VRQIEDPFIREFWAEEFVSYDERFRREAIAPIQNKLGQFLLNPVVRQSKVSFPFMMNHQRIIIANLSKGKAGEIKVCGVRHAPSHGHLGLLKVCNKRLLTSLHRSGRSCVFAQLW